MKLQKTKFHSWKTGKLAKGCELCVKGRKSVLFVTGICPANCYYCPISDKKKNQDVVYINEWPTSSLKDIIEEIRLCSSKGIGITGGDPLARIERTAKHIKSIKNRFGKNFHIHLYTPLNLINEKNLEKLKKAGLDEIRVHPNLENKRLWNRINLLKKFGWRAGIEIPVIPEKGKEIIELINFAKDKVDFINLNELEISDTNANKLVEMGFIPKDRISYGVKGSEKLAMELLRHCSKIGLNAHYCTAKLKDKVQLANRIRLRAENAAKQFDIITEEGMLIRGAIYLKELQPSFGIRNMIEKMSQPMKKKAIEKLRKNEKRLKRIGINDLVIDENKLRILTGAKAVKIYSEKIKKLQLIPAIVEEYPTYDGLEVEVEFV